VALCDRMKVSWQELQETPAYVVQDWLMVMEAEAEDVRRQRREAERKK
jgi:hypothetical protein